MKSFFQQMLKAHLKVVFFSFAVFFCNVLELQPLFGHDCGACCTLGKTLLGKALQFGWTRCDCAFLRRSTSGDFFRVQFFGGSWRETAQQLDAAFPICGKKKKKLFCTNFVYLRSTHRLVRRSEIRGGCEPTALLM